VSDLVRGTVDKVGYLALAKVLLDVKADEKACFRVIHKLEYYICFYYSTATSHELNAL
jgi:hypothetical protein